MCTRPITITRSYPLIGTKTYSVPCGKCPECLAKKRSELAALSVHQAQVSGSLHFFTLTYSNERCPVALFDPCVDKVVAFERGCEAWIRDGRFMNESRMFPDSFVHTPSLCREDVKKWLKLFRTRWFRKTGSRPIFKYCIFGELGDRRGRPHYHGLIYGLSAEQAFFLSQIWLEFNGFTYVIPSTYRKLSSDEICKVSSYVSKYVSKGVCQRFAHLLPFIEPPRRQSSLDFGQFSDDELLLYSRFMMDAILYLHPDVLQMTNYLGSLIDANLLRSMVKDMPSHNV